jgi:putative hydrolase of the HAD superfamily
MQPTARLELAFARLRRRDKVQYLAMEASVSAGSDNGSSMIKAVILDYGQVLARCPTVPEFGRMAEMFDVDFESFYRLWEESRGPYDRGDFAAEEYWLKLASQTHSSLDANQIKVLREVEVEIWSHADPAMLDWLSKLHAADIKTALLSNMPWDLVKYVRANFGWMENFSFKTFSAEVRLIKPDAAIYEYTLRGLGVPAGEALFVDDRESNVEAARFLGIRSIQFRSVAQLRSELEEIGFPVLPAVATPTVDTQNIKFQL